MWLAVELETIARQYYLTLAIGGPVLLSESRNRRDRRRIRQLRRAGSSCQSIRNDVALTMKRRDRYLKAGRLVHVLPSWTLVARRSS
jgi:hypothetical protein